MLTTDPDYAHQVLREAYADHSVSITGSPDNFLLHHRQMDLDTRFTLVGLQYRVGLNSEFEPMRDALVGRVLGGRSTFRFGDEDYSLGVGDLVLRPPETPFWTASEDINWEMVRLDLDALATYAAEVTGAPAGDFRFLSGRPVSPAMQRYWQSVVHYVTNTVLGDPVLARSPILIGQAFRKLASAMLSAFPNTATDHDPVGGGKVAAAALRRAVDYIGAHAHEDLSPGQPAEAAATTSVDLDLALKRATGKSLADLVERARLDGAHHDLRNTDGQASVAEIAAKWGFPELTRFTASYLAAFGRQPGDTPNR